MQSDKLTFTAETTTLTLDDCVALFVLHTLGNIHKVDFQVFGKLPSGVCTGVKGTMTPES